MTELRAGFTCDVAGSYVHGGAARRRSQERGEQGSHCDDFVPEKALAVGSVSVDEDHGQANSWIASPSPTMAQTCTTHGINFRTFGELNHTLLRGFCGKTRVQHITKMSLRVVGLSL